MEIIVRQKSSIPIYEQITNQIKGKIIEGSLQAGDILPSIRSLAKSLRISVITVQRAYDDLQEAGLVETVSGKGTFVAIENINSIREEKNKQIEEAAKCLINLCKENGLSLERIVGLVEIIYKEEE